MEVQILSRKMIRPSSPPQHKTMALSFFDQMCLPQFYVTSIFYYLPRDEDGDGVGVTAKSEQLQKSLSETLTVFYPYGGRYCKENLFVDCNGEGAEYLEARVTGGSLSQLLKEGVLETELRNCLHAHTFKAEHTQNTPLVKVQCNMFECGGLAVGVAVWHRLADAFTFFTFIDAWATASRVGIEKVEYPNFQFASFFPSRDLSSLKPMVPRGFNENFVAKRFVFDGAAVSKLKASARASGLLKHQPTRVEVVTSLIWRALIKTSQTRHGYLRSSFLTSSINIRGRTKVPVAVNCCGNFVGISTAKYIPDEDEGKVKFDNLVSKLHDGIGSKVKNYAQVSNGDDLFSMETKNFDKVREEYENEESDFFVIVSWCRFPKYEADFGWGKPSWVCYVSTPAPKIMLLDTADGDGIEAWVSLAESDLQLFEQSPDIIRFTTTTKSPPIPTSPPSLTS